MTQPQSDVAVLVGRFQPLHQAHAALLRRALELARHCVVVIGSAHQARTPGNPFTWTERTEMIRLALSEADRARVRCLPLRDHHDDRRWQQVLRRQVTAALAPAAGGALPSMVLVGHVKDARREYLRAFADWPLVSVDLVPGVDGGALCDALFAAAPGESDAALASLVDLVPPSTTAFLRAWLQLPFAAELRAEWRMLQAYKAAWRSAPYPPVLVTVDAVVRCAGHVLLIRRGQAPGQGLYAAPGGFIDAHETAYQSTLRELAEETHLTLLDETMRRCLRASAVFDRPDRSQRGRTITHAFHFDLGERELPEVRADDDAMAVEWVPIGRLAALEDRFHDDHFQMLDHFLGLTEADGGSNGR